MIPHGTIIQKDNPKSFPENSTTGPQFSMTFSRILLTHEVLISGIERPLIFSCRR